MTKPPTTQKKIGAEFAFKFKYLNPLPDLPFEPKLLDYPSAADKDYKWTNNSLFEKKTFDLIGDKEETCISLHQAHLDTIDKALSNIMGDGPIKEPKQKIATEDLFLLSQPADSTSKTKERSRHRPIVPWLRRTEYISSDMSKTVFKSDGIEQRMGVHEELNSPMDTSREGQIKAIEQSFEFVADAQKVQSLQHPTDKSLKVAQVYPVFPDWELWPNEYVEASFDCNPLNNEPTDQDVVKLEGALLQPMAHPMNPDINFMSYYCPTEDALVNIVSKRDLLEKFGSDLREIEGAYHYKYVRDYDYEAKVEDENQKVFFLLRPRQGAFYNYLNRKLVLKRKRARSKMHGLEQQVQKPTTIVVKRRKFNANEKLYRKERLSEVAPFENMEGDSSSESE